MGPAYNPAALSPSSCSFHSAFGSSQRHRLPFSDFPRHKHSEMNKEIQTPFGMPAQAIAWRSHLERGSGGGGS